MAEQPGSCLLSLPLRFLPAQAGCCGHGGGCTTGILPPQPINGGGRVHITYLQVRLSGSIVAPALLEVRSSVAGIKRQRRTHSRKGTPSHQPIPVANAKAYIAHILGIHSTYPCATSATPPRSSSSPAATASGKRAGVRKGGGGAVLESAACGTWGPGVFAFSSRPACRASALGWEGCLEASERKKVPLDLDFGALRGPARARWPSVPRAAPTSSAPPPLAPSPLLRVLVGARCFAPLPHPLLDNGPRER